MENGQVTTMLSGTPQGGVISPLLSNIYLGVLDKLWERRHAHLGELVRYCDDFVVLCRTSKACEEAEGRVREILRRLKLELHPEKTGRVDLSRGRQGFDFLGCHLRKRMSGPIWEKERKRVYFLQRWPSARSMKRVRQRVKEMAPSPAWNHQVPGGCIMQRPERPSVSRVREIRMHGLNGGPVWPCAGNQP